MATEVYDGQIHHSFNCLVAGPSGCGKSTFVRNLLERQNDIIDIEFDYIVIVIGTGAEENQILSNFVKENSNKCKMIELKKAYPSREAMTTQFPADFKHMVTQKKKKGLKGCVVFDDLMSELAECGILVDLFTKFTSHYDISTIHITQNLFSKTGGKRAGDNVTIYRNCHVLVLFKNPLDNSVISTIAKRISPSRFADLAAMLAHITEVHRYVVIFGDFKRSANLKFVTDLFETHPIPHQKVFELEMKSK